jgi:hypothetical protein
MDSKMLRWIGAACFVCASATANSGEFAFVKPLFKDLTPGSPGDELTITPLLNWVDTDANSYPDKLKLAFNVWDAGTNTSILQTDKITVTPPPLPCTNPAYIDDDLGIKFMGASAPSTVHMILGVEIRCEETGTGQFSENYKAIWYSANIVTGSSYVKVWKDWEVFGTNDVDWDDDGNNELQLLLEKENAAGDTAKVRVVYMTYGGTVEADNTYDVEYFNY